MVFLGESGGGRGAGGGGGVPLKARLFGKADFLLWNADNMDNKEQVEEQGFRVVDKRRFSEGSNAVDGSEDSSSKPEAAAAKPETKATPETASANKAAGEASSKVEDLPPVDFSSFVLGMAHQALVMLGQAPHPENNLAFKNLPAAKQTIDILVMLEEKTAGNLSEEENSLLSNIVSSLQLAYVDAVRSKK